MTFLLALFISLGMTLELPNDLTGGDQERMLEIIGLGTTSKFLSNSYPLGGYSGVEVSLSFESIDTSEVATLGATADRTDNVFYPSLTFGKGLFNNSDVFFHFIPSSKTSGISKYGASFRWSFYQALFFPLSASVVLHASSANLKNKIRTRNLGADILMGLSLSQFSFFLGGGIANSSGKFTGGVNGITASGNLEASKVNSSHFMFGGTYNFDPFFLGLSIDRYMEEVYTIKTGFVF